MTAPLTGAILYLDGVSVAFDGYKALRGLSLVIEPGELRAIIGPNGAGKTTMMDVVTGRTRPDEGGGDDRVVVHQCSRRFLADRLIESYWPDGRKRTR